MSLPMLFLSITTLLLSPSTATSTTPPSRITPACAPFVNLTEILSLAGPFHTFLTLLNNTQTIQTLQTQANNTNQGLTLFSPSDSAFSSLSNLLSLSNITNNQLQSLLLFHAFPKFYTITDLVKNVSGQSVPTMAGGGQFTLKVLDFSGLVGVDSGRVQANISSSVYSANPVAVYRIDEVLLPKAIFGNAPPVTSPPPQPQSQPRPYSPLPSALPPVDSDAGKLAPAPATSKKDDGISASYRNGFGAGITCFILVVSGSLMLL